jgi:hypothetical protein
VDADCRGGIGNHPNRIVNNDIKTDQRSCQPPAAEIEWGFIQFRLLVHTAPIHSGLFEENMELPWPSHHLPMARPKARPRLRAAFGVVIGVFGKSPVWTGGNPSKRLARRLDSMVDRCREGTIAPVVTKVAIPHFGTPR